MTAAALLMALVVVLGMTPLGLIPLGYGLGSIALTAAVTIVLVAAAGRLYKAMSLYKGQVPSPKDILKLIREK